MKKFFDESGSLNMDELIMERPSFQRLMADGVVTRTYNESPDMINSP